MQEFNLSPDQVTALTRAIPAAGGWGLVYSAGKLQVPDAHASAVQAALPGLVPHMGPSPADVDAERDRRTATVVFSGVTYQCDERSQQQIIALGADARFAQLGGAGVGNLRWADPNNDFGWIAANNSVTPMDAPTMVAFSEAAKLWVSRHIFAARALKNLAPIPADFADDAHWPA